MTLTLQKLHEPVCEYDSDVYNHLCTVVQALPLAVLFWVFVEKEIYEQIYNAFAVQNGPIPWIKINGPIPWIEIGKIIIVISVVCVIWHRYVLDDRFIAWRLTILDTSIPFMFTIVQSLLALSVYGPTSLFAFWIWVLTTLGIVAYWQIRKKFRHLHAKALYKEHYGNSAGPKIYNHVKRYFDDFFWWFWCYSVGTGVAVLICLPSDYTATIRAYDIDFIIVAVLSALIVGHLFIDNSNERLRRWFEMSQRQPRDRAPNRTRRSRSRALPRR